MRASIEAAVDAVTAFAGADFRADRARIDVPTRVVFGDDDAEPFKPAGKQAVQSGAVARREVCEGAAHAPAVTHANRLNEDLTAFFHGRNSLTPH